MIRLDVVQGSEEWRQARSGVISASNADRLVTPKTGKPSGSISAYAYEIIAEEMLGAPLESVTTSFMQRGNDLEADARAWYSFERDVDVEQVGFLMRDDRLCGYSPDGLVGEDGALEIKCPAAATHVGYLLGEAGEKYKSQMQFGLWVSGRQWIDFVSWNPELPPVLVRFERDDEFIAKLEEGVNRLLHLLTTHRVALRDRGVERYKDFVTEAEQNERDLDTFTDDLYNIPTPEELGLHSESQ